MPVTMSLLIAQVEPHQVPQQFHMKQTHRQEHFFNACHRCAHRIVLGWEGGRMERRHALHLRDRQPKASHWQPVFRAESYSEVQREPGLGVRGRKNSSVGFWGGERTLR